MKSSSDDPDGRRLRVGLVIGVGLLIVVFSEELSRMLIDSFLEVLGGIAIYGVVLVGLVVLAQRHVWMEKGMLRRGGGFGFVAGSLGGSTDRKPASRRGFRERYFDYLVSRYRDVDVKGLSAQGLCTLMLEDVFVELRMASSQKVKGPLRKEQSSIWPFLSSSRENHGQHLAIIGPPGSGKTTLLQHMALTLTHEHKRGLIGLPNHVPMLLFLRHHAARIAADEDYTLSDAMIEALADGGMEEGLPREWFENLLAAGRVVVMLDGLDEVADLERRQQVVAWVQAQMARYARNHFVVTSRPLGYQSNPLDGVTVLEVQPFTPPQVRSFVERWYLANEIRSFRDYDFGVRMKAQEGAEDLLRRLQQSEALSRLAVNPLLLTMIATVHRYRSSLPNRRVELYAELCEVFLGKLPQLDEGELGMTPAQKQHVLQVLAYEMMRQERRQMSREAALEIITDPLALVNPMIDAETFLRVIERSSGLLLEQERGQYSFAHLTFQEYLAAVHIFEQQLEAELLPHVDESWWHETIQLYCAQADATPILRACLNRTDASGVTFSLAVACEREALRVDSGIRRRLDLMRQMEMLMAA